MPYRLITMYSFSMVYSAHSFEIDSYQYDRLQQAGDMAGIEDAHYLSRLFRKYYGMSFRAYRADYKKYGAES